MLEADPDSSYKQVQGLSRGIAVLRALSRSPQGRSELSDISAATGLHRTTVRRLLETLRLEGFVERSEEDGLFQLTLELKRMSDGFTVSDKIAEIAAPILQELSAEVTWPCALATPDDDCMVIRQSTHSLSPLSFHRGALGRRLPMLMTSMGRAYLAFCTESAREHTLALIAAKYESGEVPFMSLATFRQILIRTREDGYGSNYGEWQEDKKVAAIAVPVMGDRKSVVACLNVVAITRAVQPKQLGKKFLAPLLAAADALQRTL